MIRFCLFPDITACEQGIAMESMQWFFLTESVRDFFSVICIFQTSLVSPNYKSVLKTFAGCSIKKLDTLIKSVMFSLKFYIIHQSYYP